MGTLGNTLIQNWIGPVFLLIIAGYSIKFLLSRQFRELAGFVVIGALVALMIYGGDTLFGETGLLTKIAQGFSNLIVPEGGGASKPSGAGNFINILRLWIR